MVAQDNDAAGRGLFGQGQAGMAGWLHAWPEFSPAAFAAPPGADPADISKWMAQSPVLSMVEAMWNANPVHGLVPIDWAGVAHALRVVWLRSLANPGPTMQAAATFGEGGMRAATAAFEQAAQQFWGMFGAGWPAGATQAAGVAAKPGPADKRFASPDWQANPVFLWIKTIYLLASDYLLQGIADGEADPAEQQRVVFHLRQFVDAMSPSLMLISNPVALRRALETGGMSLADGLRNLLADIERGKLSMVDATAFAPGRNLALTPGKVVFRNALIELLQYSPTTATVGAIPLLILPPWINKFYILDMQPKNSMVKYLVDQGITVFMVSWKNPDAEMEATTIEDYMHFGPLAASDVIRTITGGETVNVMGYCIGGTLMAMTLAWLAAKGDQRFAAATFMVSLQDFSTVGDTAVFSDESSISLIEDQMLQRGYLDSREMSNMFNLLRSNELIWANVVNNYLLGQKPPAFDLLHWNADGTRMARAAHSWYLRNTYLENNLITPGKVTLDGQPLDLGRITLDVYAVGAEKDHIVPWQSAWRVTQLLGGPVRYVLASSGHIAGIINPPGGKGTYWAADSAAGFSAETAELWRAAATAHDGSWWSDWARWLAAHSGARVVPPGMGSAAHPALADAPGRYVLEA